MMERQDILDQIIKLEHELLSKSPSFEDPIKDAFMRGMLQAYYEVMGVNHVDRP